MKETMRLTIKPIFDGKVSNSVCHNLNELCGQKWTKEEIKEILRSTDKCYLNEIGRKFTIGRIEVVYTYANYLLVKPKPFISTKGEQLYVWLFRKISDESFGKINIGVEDDFDYAVVNNYYLRIDRE